MKEHYELEDFPPVDDLLRYGIDVPVPTSFDELLCEYSENERTPPLQLHELEGYCVPPEGIVKVWVNGVGARQKDGKAVGPMVYPPGTFRENRHTVGKELGVSPIEINEIRAQKRREAARQGIIEALEKNQIEMSGRTPEELIGTLVYVVLDKALQEGAPLKELRLLAFNDLQKILIPEDDTPAQIKKDMLAEVGEKTLEMLDDYLAVTKRLIDEKKGEVIDTVAWDVSGEGQD